MVFTGSTMKPMNCSPLDGGKEDDFNGYNAYTILTKGNSLVVNIV